MSVDSSKVWAVILDLKPSESCSEREVFGVIQDFLDGDGAHNGVLGFIDKGANLASWLGTVGSVAAGEVGRQISFASKVLQADLVSAYGRQKGRHAWTSGEFTLHSLVMAWTQGLLSVKTQAWCIQY